MTIEKQLGIETPLICGPMYPCSNPELVAAVSEAGGIGVVQPVSLVYVHKYPFREGIRAIRKRTEKPIGFNALIEHASKTYENRMRNWIEEALEEGIRFFITSLGNPKWVVDMVAPHGGIVYHDVIHAKHAAKAKDGGVHGFIAVNNRAGGHAGNQSPDALLEEIKPFGLPVVCAGGVGTAGEFVNAMAMGYDGVQMGTRFIATTECTAHDDYKQAIVRSSESDIVLTERLTGVPVSVINTPYIERVGTQSGPFARWMLRGRQRKKIMRTLLFLRSGLKFKRSLFREVSDRDYLQAGKSVHGIHRIESAADLVKTYAAALEQSKTMGETCPS
ncbi:MAG: nitronate monooxygenase [Acidobacteria bacterium]|nr:nitronate monooxygenase [Acidobacteriota bacterium]